MVVFVGIGQFAYLAREVWRRRSPSSRVTGISSVVADLIRWSYSALAWASARGTYLGGPERSFYVLRLRGRLEGGQSHQE